MILLQFKSSVSLGEVVETGMLGDSIGVMVFLGKRGCFGVLGIWGGGEGEVICFTINIGEDFGLEMSLDMDGLKDFFCGRNRRYIY